MPLKAQRPGKEHILTQTGICLPLKPFSSPLASARFWMKRFQGSGFLGRDSQRRDLSNFDGKPEFGGARSQWGIFLEGPLKLLKRCLRTKQGRTTPVASGWLFLLHRGGLFQSIVILPNILLVITATENSTEKLWGSGQGRGLT